MYYYKEIEPNIFELSTLDGSINSNSSKDEYICHIKDTTIIFRHDWRVSFKHYPIKKLDGRVLYQSYHTCSNSCIGETLILLLEALGYKSYSRRGDEISVGIETIEIPVYCLSSGNSVFVSIECNEENKKDIYAIPYFGRKDKFFDVSSKYLLFPSKIKSFIKNKTLYVSTRIGRENFRYTTGDIESAINSHMYTDVWLKYLFIDVIDLLEDYFRLNKVYGRKTKAVFFKRALKKSKSDELDILLFNDYINDLIQKKLIDKLIKL